MPFLPHRSPLPLALFIATLLSLAIATAVQAAATQSAANPSLSSSQIGALSVLGAGIVALSIYLFFAMFQPEKF